MATTGNTATSLNLPFRPRARLLQLLGDQLIGTPRLAVFELVKNAYDADAETVRVVLKGLNSGKPSLVVSDDGDGMTLETIRDIWLVPAHDHRRIQRAELRRTKLGRLPLGEKGLGRFAVHKLGDKIEMVTRAADAAECVVTIDWAALIGENMLSDAMVHVTTRVPEVYKNKSTGTRLTISELRESNWPRGEVRRLLRQITSISSPFGDKSDVFEARLEVPEHPEWVAGIPDVEALMRRAPWQFWFRLRDGVFEWKYTFRGVTGLKVAPRAKHVENGALQIPALRGESDEANKGGTRTRAVLASSETTKDIGPVEGNFYVFDRDREILSKLGDTQLVQNYLDENGGVRVYRDKIRVYNYGEPGDDWLGLDLRRVNSPTRNISRNIVVGAVDLSLEKSAELMEKTNREGFVDNEPYRELQRVVLGALGVLEVERKIDKDNIRALTAKASDPESERIAQPLEKLREAAKRHNVSGPLGPLIDKVERDYNEMRETLLRAGISNMGLAVVFHEIEQGVRVLSSAIEGGAKEETVQSQARELVRILDGFTELLRKGERRRNSLKQLIRRVRDVNSVRFRAHHVRLVCPSLEDTAPDAESVYAFGLGLGALNNLLDNAFHWLKVRWPEDAVQAQRAIYMRLDPEFAEGPAIIVADNGPGFQDDPERVTRPFFSRRPDGMGVGLYYANLVMELNGGRLAFPGADEAGLPEEFDGAVLALVFAPVGKK